MDRRIFIQRERFYVNSMRKNFNTRIEILLDVQRWYFTNLLNVKNVELMTSFLLRVLDWSFYNVSFTRK